LVDRCFRARDRLLKSPDFQRFSAGFPLTRPIASRQAQALFDLCAGFVYSQVLSACIELDLFERLAEGPSAVAELSRELEIPANKLERLLLAACTLKLVARRSGGRFGLGMLGAALNGNPGIAAMVRHHAVLYRDLADPVALLRTGEASTGTSKYWPYARARDPATLGDAEVGRYSELMTASQPLIAEDVLNSYPFARHRVMLDVGGGEGAFIETVAQRYPQLKFVLCDLPAVATRARARINASSLGSRVAVSGLNFFSDALPQGADLVTFVRVLHDHDEAAVRVLLRAARAALAPGGSILVAEPMTGVPRSETVGAYFDMYMMAMGQGRPRTAPSIRSLLSDEGFVDVRSRRTSRPMLVGVVSASRAPEV
jgi:demethylspheroidene O-methyltransferase